MSDSFNEKFNSYVCVDDSINAELNGIEYTATIHFDDHSHINDDDYHNTDQNVTGCDDEQQKKLLAARQEWFDGHWFYCGIIVSASKGGIDLGVHESLWGIEADYMDSDNSHLNQIANELLEQAIEQVPDKLADILETLTA
jgi:hypothetical protein